jgi:hypothetical protein
VTEEEREQRDQLWAKALGISVEDFRAIEQRLLRKCSSEHPALAASLRQAFETLGSPPQAH